MPDALHAAPCCRYGPHLPSRCLDPQKRTPRQAEEDEVSAELASARSEAMRGHFLFEQRLLHSVVEEDSALSAARQLRHQLRRWACRDACLTSEPALLNKGHG